MFFIIISWKRAQSVILRGYVSGAGAKSEEEEEEEGLRPTRLRPSLLVRRGAGTPTASHKTIF